MDPIACCIIHQLRYIPIRMQHVHFMNSASEYQSYKIGCPFFVFSISNSFYDIPKVWSSICTLNTEQLCCQNKGKVFKWKDVFIEVMLCFSVQWITVPLLLAKMEEAEIILCYLLLNFTTFGKYTAAEGVKLLYCIWKLQVQYHQFDYLY